MGHLVNSLFSRSCIQSLPRCTCAYKKQFHGTRNTATVRLHQDGCNSRIRASKVDKVGDVGLGDGISRLKSLGKSAGRVSTADGSITSSGTGSESTAIRSSNSCVPKGISWPRHAIKDIDVLQFSWERLISQVMFMYFSK